MRKPLSPNGRTPTRPKWAYSRIGDSRSRMGFVPQLQKRRPSMSIFQDAPDAVVRGNP